MKTVDVKPSTYIGFSEESNKEDPKFQDGDHVRISKHDNKLEKAMFQSGLKTFFVFKQVKDTLPFTYFISDLKGKEIVGTFYEKEL